MLTSSERRGQVADDGFSFRSDRLSLDFAATLMFRGSEEGPRELLDSHEKLVRWTLASGFLSTLTPSAACVLSEAIELREAIYRTASTRISFDMIAASDVAVLNRHGALPSVSVALGADDVISRSGTLTAVLASIARDAIELLGGDDAERLRHCGRSGCTRMFIDNSRGRTRIWCGMRECGNRVNAAAYRRRRAGS
jgi:predicted RNA-binding Zn ribbon-like protein